MHSVAVLVPYYGGYDPEHFTCLLFLQSLWRAEGKLERNSIFPLHSCPYIDMARAILTARAMATDVDTLFFVDHDIVFEPSDVDRLVDVLWSRPDIDVIGAGYSMRMPGGKLIGGILPSAVPKSGEIPFFDAPGAGPIEARYTGFGFTAIKRHVIERLSEMIPAVNCGWERPVHPLFSLLIQDGVYFGEDVSFCRRVRRAGMRVWLDTSFRICHKGSYKYKLEDMGMQVPSVGQLTIRNNPEGPSPSDVRQYLPEGFQP